MLSQSDKGLATCKRCGETHCAWVQSKKTGNWYLADAYWTKPSVGYSGNGPYRTGGLTVLAWQPHVCGFCPVQASECTSAGRNKRLADLVASGQRR